MAPLIHLWHSPYIREVILVVKCPTCGMPAGVECVGYVTHESRLIAYFALTGFTVDQVYARLGVKPAKIKNQ